MPPENVKFEPKLPSPDTIYYKDFHFLDEPLINRKHIRNSDSTLNKDTSASNGSSGNQNTSTSVPLVSTSLLNEPVLTPTAMTLSNQKDLNNQTDRNLSKNRIIPTANNNSGNSLTNVKISNKDAAIPVKDLK